MTSKNLSSSKLVAILFADIQDYTALMQRHQSEAAALLRRFQSELKSTIPQFKGRIVNFYGDGALSVFETPEDAVRCAMRLNMIFQSEPKTPVRLGVHSGPVMFEGDKVFGNSINVTSRIESMGLPGTVLISDRIRLDIKNHPDILVEQLGTFNFKNVEEPLGVYAIANDGFIIPRADELKGKFEKPRQSNLFSISPVMAVVGIVVIVGGLFLINQLGDPKVASGDPVAQDVVRSSLSEKSIAVLPFKNMSGQEDLEYVSEGMTHEIISRLAMIGDIIKVPSFQSVLKYKNTDQSLIEIANELTVSNILQGSFQKAGNQFRITLQLIDGKSDNQIWTQTYSGRWQPEEIFNIQATVTENVADKLNSTITASEIESIQKIPTKNKEAYIQFLQAEHQRHKSSEEAFAKAIPLYERAIAIDSSFTDAYLGLASIWNNGGLVWGFYGEDEAWEKTKANVYKAIALDSTNYAFDDHLFSGSFFYEWNFDFCEPKFLRRVEDEDWKVLDRSTIDYANKTLRSDVALLLAERLIYQRPSFGTSFFSKAEALYYLDRKDEALEILKEADLLFSDQQFYLRESARYYYYLKEYDRFKSHLDILMNSFTDRAPIHFWMNVVRYRLEGNEEEVNNYLNQIKEKYDDNDSGSPAWFMAMYYFDIGEEENGFLWLQKSFDRHEVEMTWLQREPILNKFRSDPRYIAIHQQMEWPKVLKD